MKHSCPRCAGTNRAAGICHTCKTDIALERSYGITIPPIQWPIENLAKFQATAALAEIRGIK